MPPRSRRPQSNGRNSDSDNRYLELAWVVKPHGLYGGVWVDLNTDFPERLPEWPHLELVDRGGAREVRVEYVHGITGGRCIVKFENVEDRDQAEALRGATLRGPRDEVPPLPEGEYYDFQIIGLRVVTTEGRDLGRVREILRTGANDIFETDEALIPAVDEFICEIDLERGEIVVEEVPGLLD